MEKNITENATLNPAKNIANMNFQAINPCLQSNNINNNNNIEYIKKLKSQIFELENSFISENTIVKNLRNDYEKLKCENKILKEEILELKLKDHKSVIDVVKANYENEIKTLKAEQESLRLKYKKKIDKINKNYDNLKLEINSKVILNLNFYFIYTIYIFNRFKHF